MECQCFSEPYALAQGADRTLTLTVLKNMRHLHFRSVYFVARLASIGHKNILIMQLIAVVRRSYDEQDI
jgi:hypothetical protein